jgi:dipeptidase E
MKRILITSSGFLRKPIREEIKKFVPQKEDLKVAYIPSASRVVKDDEYAKKDVEIMQGLGYVVDEIDLAEVTGEMLEQRLRENDVIYVQGGNPYWLLKEARESGFMDIVPKLINEGMPYVGKSAGAYILSPAVVVPEWLGGNWRRFDVEDTRGMGIVDFVWAAHYVDEYDQILKKEAGNVGFEVRAITNDQAILVEGDSIRTIGVGPDIVIRPEGQMSSVEGEN